MDYGTAKAVAVLSAAAFLAACNSQIGQPLPSASPSAIISVSAAVCTPADLTTAVNQFFTLWNSAQAEELTNLLALDVATTISTEDRQGDQTPSVSGRQPSAQLIAQQVTAREQISYRQILRTTSGPAYRVSAFIGGVVGAFPDGRTLTYSDAKFGYDCVSRGLYVVLLWTASAPVKS